MHGLGPMKSLIFVSTVILVFSGLSIMATPASASCYIQVGGQCNNGYCTVSVYSNCDSGSCTANVAFATCAGSCDVNVLGTCKPGGTCVVNLLATCQPVTSTEESQVSQSRQLPQPNGASAP